MGVVYGVFNHSKKEYVQPDALPVDAEDPVMYPFSAFITNLMVNTWRHDHVVILDDSGDIECDYSLAKKYRDRSVELWNEFVSMYDVELPDLKSVGKG